MDYPGFIGPAYTIQNISADNQKCVNLYPQQDESGAGKNSAYLLSTPGLNKVLDLSGTIPGGVRGTYTASNDRFFAVMGASLVELNPDLSMKATYALPGETGTGPVSMTDNGQDLLIVTGPNGYWLNFVVGALATIAIDDPGKGWAIGDSFTIAGGNGGVGQVTALETPPTLVNLANNCVFSNTVYNSGGVGLYDTATILTPSSAVVVGQTILFAYTPSVSPFTFPFQVLATVTSIPDGSHIVVQTNYSATGVAFTEAYPTPAAGAGTLSYFTSNFDIPSTPTNNTIAATGIEYIDASHVLLFPVAGANLYLGCEVTISGAVDPVYDTTFILSGRFNISPYPWIGNLAVPITTPGGSGGTVAYNDYTLPLPGVPSAIALVNPGNSYTAGAGVSTTAQAPSTGTGLTLTTTTLSTDTLTKITDAVFEGATSCGFCDGYVLFNQPGTQIFWITNLYSTVINPLGFASAEGSPDNLLSLLVDHREIWLFGDISTEVWYDAGGANFPFSFIQGAYISHGIAAPLSAVRLDNTTFWLGNDEFGNGIVWKANGYAPVRISTYSIEQAIQRYPAITDAVAWTYQQDGHSFYVLNFPSGDATWVYDAATGQWHERAYLGTLTVNDGSLHRGRPQTHSFAFGKHIVGDWEKAILYQMSPAFLNDDTRQIPRIRRAPYIDNQKKRIFFSQFQLDAEVGQGNPSGDGSPPSAPADPQISLRWSDDGGYTWSNYQTISMGVSGAYKARVIWRRLGQSRQRIFEVSASQSDVGLNLYNAYLELIGVNS